TFYSITEYSQRYQKPKRGDWFNPYSKDSEHYQEVEDFYNYAFTTFENLIDKLHSEMLKDFKKKNPNVKGKDLKKEEAALLKLAFEDARYVLPLSMYTQLGMSANGRAWRDGLSKLDASMYPEIVSLKEDLKKEISTVLPVLLKHADASDYQNKIFNKSKSAIDTSLNVLSSDYDDIFIIDTPNETTALKEILSLVLMEENNI